MSWKICKISDIFDVARGGSPRPIQNYLTDSPEGLNWIMIGDTVDGSKYITSTKKRIKPEGLTKTRMVHEGDFLLTNSMSFGRPYILKISGCIHDGWLVLSPKVNEVFPDFFFYLLGSDTLYQEFAKRAAGAVVKNLNTTLVKHIQIPLPPLAEQKRIAAILDAADTLRAKRREAIAQLDSFLQSTFVDMFGDPVRNEKGWEVISGAKAFANLTYGTSEKAFDEQTDCSLPVLRIPNILGGKILWSDLKYIKLSGSPKDVRISYFVITNYSGVQIAR
jgi:type I restriction enzyme, S subunit